jgi:hypothetical protein
MMSSVIQAARGDQDATTSVIRGRIAANAQQIAILTVLCSILPEICRIGRFSSVMYSGT